MTTVTKDCIGLGLHEFVLAPSEGLPTSDKPHIFCGAREGPSIADTSAPFTIRSQETSHSTFRRRLTAAEVIGMETDMCRDNVCDGKLE